MGAVRQLEARIFARLKRPPPEKLFGRLALWLAVVTLLAAVLHLLPGVLGVLFTLLFLLAAGALVFVLLPILWRATIGRVLWKVRNRLIATYLLMGLAPLVLFFALSSISTYIFLGQFAVFAASSAFDRTQQSLAAQNIDYAHHLAAAASASPSAVLALPERAHPSPLLAERPLGETEFRGSDKIGQSSVGTRPAEPRVAAFLDGKPVELSLDAGSVDTSVAVPPAWLPAHFEGWVLADSRFLIRVVDTVQVERAGRAAQHITVVSTLPVDERAVAGFAAGLGRITIIPERQRLNDEEARPVASEAEEKQLETATAHAVSGGTLRRAQHFFDIPVNFYVPLDTVDWSTGKQQESSVRIVSRPTLLYQRLFITSLQVATYVQYVLVALTIFFGLLELGAFLMAVRLNQTITQSIHDLYGATLALDRREFFHRIGVKRNDQLGALSLSFNTMAASLETLVEEQREKERMQGELEIAQQVQANLFPQGDVSLPRLEVYGICQPARTVSGDYYDFLRSSEDELTIALGDISGKGISAALLMATLHSAVHAYRYAGDDFRTMARELAPVGAVAGPATQLGVHSYRQQRRQADASAALSASFHEPSQVLALLNRHLYRSTQAEKYATLFLAYYDGLTSELTYSNGGHLPPLLLRADGSVTRLDCGGTVIGLLDGMSYEQGRERLLPGDIVIAYSDGVTEPENEYGEFGEERLLEVVRLHRHLPLEAIGERVLESIRSWIGATEQPDDITLVLLRRR